KRIEPAAEQRRHRFFGDIAQENGGDGNTELGGGQLPIEVVQGLLDDASLAVSLLDEAVTPGSSGGNQRKRGGNKKRVRRQQDDDSEDAKPKVGEGGFFHGGEH